MRKDGTILWVSINIRGHFDDDGTLTETRSMVLDITARKNAEAELRKSQEQFEDLYENAPIAYSTRRAEDGKLIRHNAAFAKLLGYERVEIQQMEGFEFYPDTPDGLPKIQRWFEDFRADPKPAVSEVQVRRKDGQLRWVTASSEPRFDENGKLIESRSAVTDITERRRDEERLRAARAEAEGANRAKSEFLSSMSHELRTPMNTVLGFAQILKSDPESPLNPDQTESIDQIIHGGTHLLELINEVLDLSRIESGGADLSPEWVDLGELAAESLDLMAPLADHRRITLVNDVGDRGGRAWADYTRLKQVLLNLVSNAVKYNVDGGTVTISALPTAAGRARVAITDTGPGIAEDRLDELFAPFVRLGAEWSEVEGTGIGLTITKRLVELMDGEIGVQTGPGRGSTFWIDLPRTAPAEAADMEMTSFKRSEESSDSAPIGGEHAVLYIEDNPANVRLMRKIIARRPECSLIDAPTGELGLEMAAAHRPDIIIIDINLPGIDGFEVFRRLQIADEGRDTPVIAPQCRRHGPRHPARPGSRIPGVSDQADRGAPAAARPRPRPGPGAGGGGMTDAAHREPILIVDDNPANVRMLEKMLAAARYTNVECLTDPRKVAPLCRRRRFDLILLDIRMPHLSGFDVMAQLADQSGDDYLPILVLTAQSDRETWLKALGAGAKDFLTKPFDREEVLNRIRNMLDVRLLHNQVRDQQALLEESLRERTADLRNALESAEAASEAKSQFLAIVSHELRTPLTAILGFAELMKGETLAPLDSRYRKYVEDIHASGRSLLKMVNDLLDTVNVETGSLELDEQEVDVAAIVADSVQAAQAAIGPSRPALETGVPADLPALWADPTLVRRSVTEVIANGLKFTPTDGKVDVTAGRNDKGALVIEIRDTGIGISSDHIERILTPFGQTDVALDRRNSGVGLGLSLARAFTELHGGHLSVHSRVGRGTTVALTFPRVRVAGDDGADTQAGSYASTTAPPG